MDDLYGKDKLDAIDKVNDALKEENRLLEIKIREAKEYLKKHIIPIVGKDGNIKILSAKSNLYKVTNYEDGIDIDHLIIYNQLNKEVKVPDTASNVKIVLVALGVALVCGGGAFVYKRYYAK